MSSHEPPGDAPRDRWTSDDDPTRYQDPPPHGGDARPGPPPGEDRTQHLDAVDTSVPEREPWEATVHHGQGAPGYAAEAPRTGRGPERDEPYRGEPPEEPGRRWGKGTVLVLVGLVFGFLLALVVVALGTEDAGPTDVESAVALERIDELEAELAERDAQIADLQARLDEAGADAGEADEALAAQRAALDERAAELDARSANLADREATLVERERQVDAREAAVAERERAADEGEPPPDDGDDDDDDGFDLPDIDGEDVDGFIDQVLDRIRDLF